MKKNIVFIFLPILFLLVFVSTKRIFIEKKIPTYTSTAINNFNPCQTPLQSEIEICDLYKSLPGSYKSLQKTSWHFSDNIKVNAAEGADVSINTLYNKGLFNNTALSHNYPAHHFW